MYSRRGIRCRREYADSKLWVAGSSPAGRAKINELAVDNRIAAAASSRNGCVWHCIVRAASSVGEVARLSLLCFRQPFYRSLA